MLTTLNNQRSERRLWGKDAEQLLWYALGLFIVIACAIWIYFNTYTAVSMNAAVSDWITLATSRLRFSVGHALAEKAALLDISNCALEVELLPMDLTKRNPMDSRSWTFMMTQLADMPFVRRVTFGVHDRAWETDFVEPSPPSPSPSPSPGGGGGGRRNAGGGFLSTRRSFDGEWITVPLNCSIARTILQL